MEEREEDGEKSVEGRGGRDGRSDLGNWVGRTKVSYRA
jgi:hypothetical protein